MMLSLKYIVFVTLVLCIFACINVKAEYGGQSVTFSIDIYNNITWPKDITRGVKVCSATSTISGNNTTISARNCFNGYNVFNKICVFFRESSGSNNGVLNCDIGYARSLSELIQVEPFDDGNPFVGRIFQFERRDYHYTPFGKSRAVKANTSTLNFLGNGYKTQTIEDAQFLFQDKPRSKVIALLKDKKLYAFENYMRNPAFKVLNGTEYTICSIEGASRFILENERIQPVLCPRNYVNCKELEKSADKVYKNKIHSIYYYPEVSVVSVDIGYDSLGVSANNATCKFNNTDNDIIFCIDRTKRQSLIQCKWGQQCQGGLVCHSSNSLMNDNVMVGEISIYEEGGEIVMRSQKPHGFVRDSILISESFDGTVGIADRLGRLKAIVFSGLLNTEDPSTPVFKDPYPLFCSENMNNIRICMPDASITNATRFNKMVKRMDKENQFYVLVNGKHIMFNRKLQAVGDGIQTKKNSIWYGETTLLATLINKTFYTIFNANAHNLCSC